MEDFLNMRTKSEIFFENMKDKKIAFIGVGVSHTDLIKLFLKKGLNVTVCDKKTAEQMKEYEELKAAGAAFSLGESYLTAWQRENMTLFSVPPECTIIMKHLLRQGFTALPSLPKWRYSSTFVPAPSTQ